MLVEEVHVVYRVLPRVDAADYDKVKEAMLKSLEVSEKTHRQWFWKMKGAGTLSTHRLGQLLWDELPNSSTTQRGHLKSYWETVLE